MTLSPHDKLNEDAANAIAEVQIKGRSVDDQARAAMAVILDRLGTVTEEMVEGWIHAYPKSPTIDLDADEANLAWAQANWSAMLAASPIAALESAQAEKDGK